MLEECVGLKCLSPTSDFWIFFFVCFEQECFTYVLKGHIAVSAAIFPTGTKGRWFVPVPWQDQGSNMSKFGWKTIHPLFCSVSLSPVLAQLGCAGYSMASVPPSAPIPQDPGLGWFPVSALTNKRSGWHWGETGHRGLKAVGSLLSAFSLGPVPPLMTLVGFMLLGSSVEMSLSTGGLVLDCKGQDPGFDPGRWAHTYLPSTWPCPHSWPPACL